MPFVAIRFKLAPDHHVDGGFVEHNCLCANVSASVMFVFVFVVVSLASTNRMHEYCHDGFVIGIMVGGSTLNI